MTDAVWQRHGHSVRWSVCLLVVLLVHGGAGVVLLSRITPPPHEVEMPALMLKLAPVATPPPAPVAEPEPALPQPAAEPEPPPPLPVEIPPPEPPPELVLQPPQAPATPEVAVPPKPPPKPPRPRQITARPVPAEPPPPVSAPPAAAPSPSPPSPAVAASWQSRLLAHLTRFKRYPPAAQMRREQGVAMLRFSMTPGGEVLSFRLERSSGHSLLDQETLELIRRAQPLPALPPEMGRQPIELVVPLRYELR
jgi:protein TonB